MKTGSHSAIVVLGVYFLVMNSAWAQKAAVPQRLFACSLGKKSVSVTALGHQLIYRFGTSPNIELSMTGSAERGNVFYWEDRYAGMERQLRFSKGKYSYIVYTMEGNSRTGALPVSGLTVMKGTQTIADMPCRHYAEFDAGFDLGSLPMDTADYSAM